MFYFLKFLLTIALSLSLNYLRIRFLMKFPDLTLKLQVKIYIWSFIFCLSNDIHMYKTALGTGHCNRSFKNIPYQIYKCCLHLGLSHEFYLIFQLKHWASCLFALSLPKFLLMFWLMLVISCIIKAKIQWKYFFQNSYKHKMKLNNSLLQYSALYLYVKL